MRRREEGRARREEGGGRREEGGGRGNEKHITVCYETYNIITQQRIRYRYTMPTRAVWDLLPEPSGSGNNFHAARGGVV